MNKKKREVRSKVILDYFRRGNKPTSRGKTKIYDKKIYQEFNIIKTRPIENNEIEENDTRYEFEIIQHMKFKKQFVILIHKYKKDKRDNIWHHKRTRGIFFVVP